MKFKITAVVEVIEDDEKPKVCKYWYKDAFGEGHCLAYGCECNIGNTGRTCGYGGDIDG